MEADPDGPEPEHLEVLRRCRLPTSVADLAADLDLPVGVVRILLADMRERGLVMVHQPSSSQMSDPAILRKAADGLRRL
jgi:DNA-binding IclR family transcriptional regulator